jgi:heme-degrading monooxygenase HmoA
MVVVLFRSRLTEAAGDDYADMAAEMVAAARTMPGFIDVKGFTAPDGERMTIVHWQDLETMKAWRDHARHREAKRLGRERWYANYTIEIAEVVQTREFRREDAPATER